MDGWITEYTQKYATKRDGKPVLFPIPWSVQEAGLASMAGYILMRYTTGFHKQYIVDV